MKTNVTYVDAAKFETILLASGLTCIPQKGFIKVVGPRGRQVYVATTKRVGRVDVSGFTCELPGIRDLDGSEKHGSVAQGLDFSRTEDEILASFSALLTHMQSLSPVEKVARKKPAPKADAPKGWTQIDTSPEARKRTAEDIKRIAKAKVKKVHDGHNQPEAE